MVIMAFKLFEGLLIPESGLLFELIGVSDI